MAIYQITEVKQQQRGEWNADASRSYTRILQCLSNDANDDASTVLAAVCAHLGITPGVPIIVVWQVGNGIDTFAYLKKINVLQETNHRGEYKNWIARLDYDSQLDQMPDNPLLRPTVVTGGFQMYQKPVEKDFFGKPILNTANQKLEGIEIDDARPHVTMVRNEVTYDWTLAQQYVNRVNSSPFYGAGIGQVKCANIGGQGPNTENNVTYYTVTYEFQFRQEGWQPSYQNRGRKNKDGTPCTDQNGNEMDEPAYLDANGKQLAWPVDSNAVTFVTPTAYGTVDFNILALP